ncbi:unnamed protein product, partial [Prorocentrum cordatum]
GGIAPSAAGPTLARAAPWLRRMQKLRRLNFFDRHVVKSEGADLHVGVQKLSIACAAGGPDHLWLGSRSGEVRRLDRHFSLSQPVSTYDKELLDLKVARGGQRLVALGNDLAATGACKLKVFDAGREELVLLNSLRVFPARAQEHRASCFATTSGLTVLAVGVDTGVVYLFKGRDLSQDKPFPTVLGGEGGPPITGLQFLEQGSRTVLFACSMTAVRCWAVQSDADSEVRLLSEEGNMSAMPLEGEKMLLTRFGPYFVAVTAEGAPGGLGGTVASSPSAMPKQNVVVCRDCMSAQNRTSMRFIAYTGQFTDIIHVTEGMGSIFVLSRGGADGNTLLFELREKALPEQLDILLKKRMFEWAAEVAIQGGSPGETVADIYRQHGDALFEKRAYDQALVVYAKTIGLGLPLEPSYVVERYLDAQRIGHVARYLKALHKEKLAEREHTALLLKCYTKLKDFSALEEFLETTPPSQYDPGTAIEVLEGAGYYGLAADIAQKAGRHEEFVQISLEHFKGYAQTVDFLRTLRKKEAGKILLQHGRLLMRHAPEQTVEVVRDVCGLGDGGPRAEGSEDDPPPPVDELLPVFVDSQPQLELFLRGILLASGSCPLPHAEAERLFPTLLELMVRAHRDERDEDRRQKLHAEVMRLVRQYPSEEALVSTLMTCQTFSFVDGFFYAAEKLGRFQLLMSWCFERRDAKRLLEVCKRCGSVDQSLWVQALSFLGSDEGDHTEEIGEVLRHVEESDLMPLLMVIETLQRSPHTTVGAVRPYLQGQFRRLVESVETSRGRAKQDRQEIARMQQEIGELRTRAQVFQNTRCFQCGLSLEVPAVHFFCGHSYHSYCVPADGGCPKCASEALPKIALKDQREAQASNRTSSSSCRGAGARAACRPSPSGASSAPSTRPEPARASGGAAGTPEGGRAGVERGAATRHPRARHS